MARFLPLDRRVTIFGVDNAMKHLGDITKINGAEVPPVNVVIGGSPCQDLSVAGGQKGFNGERSVLFMDQIRIVKEMRAKYGKPRFMVWENVPGAFSSNKGADFAAVLTETVRIAEPKAPAVPMPKNGWPTAGCLTGDGVGGKWSVAWRVFDAQFWGVPQRRRRIALIADFGGMSAPEILFERESVSGYFEQGRTAWKATTTCFESGIIPDDRVLGVRKPPPLTLKVRCGTQGSGGRGALIQTDQSATLSTFQDQTLFQPVGEQMATQEQTYCIQGNCIDRADTAGCNGKGWTEDVSYTLNTVDRPAVVSLLNDQGGSSISGTDDATVAPTLRAEMHGNIPAVSYGFKSLQGAKAHGIGFEEGISPTLSAGQADATVVIALDNHPQDSRVKLSENNVVQTLSGQMGTGGNNTPMVLECYSQDAYDKYTPNDTSSTLKNSGGSYGGGIGGTDS